MDDTALAIMKMSGSSLCCSQILIKLALDDMGLENPMLIRAMAGLCEGLGCGEICGVATGGLCVLALYAAGDSETPPLERHGAPMLPLLSAQFMDWFQEQGATAWGGFRCDDILAHHGGKRPEVCVGIMREARQYLLGLLAEHELDPTLARSE
ncbi:MAG: C-GCAxxG-C-C family protein [Desulfobulbaceae bacterium]|jgi:hypothetical protein|nr:C-GCAxxG-C-C family protein [Desulfobulbaceae bacterium]